MDGVRFFRDVNSSKKGFNGLCIFTGHATEGRGKDGKHKTGWEGITAQRDGAGDGPYVAHRVSETYLRECCTEVTEAEARTWFPKLLQMVEDSRDVWAS